MSQRSNRKQKILAKLRKKGYNPPGSNRAKSIPIGYYYGCMVYIPEENTAGQEERIV